MSEHAEHAGHHEINYVRIWQILLVLLIISVAGPFLGIKVVTLITAFGIAIVKAYLVAKNFMHLNIEPRYAVYLLLTMLVFMLLFFAGSAPDVMKHEGHNWVKPLVSSTLPSAPHHGAHGETHGEAAAHH